MNKGDVGFLNQLIGSLEQAQIKLREAYNSRNAEEFNKIKKFMLNIQKQIAEVLK